jgi:hypothetical protein
MRSLIAPVAWLPLLTAAALVWPQDASAQAFSADYGLSPRRAGLNLGPVRVAPMLQADARFSGAGLSVDAGRDWFARIGVGRELQQTPALSMGPGSAQVLSIAGGYRFGGGQALSLQLSRGAADRLGLSVSYDWPRYFVQLSYDTALTPSPSLSALPQDSKLRFSAGVRF